jgi:putative transposase
MELYHVMNRGVDKRSIFEDDRDRVRFIHNLYEFNDTAPAGNAYKSFQNMDIVSPYFGRERNRLVDIHGWVLMGNHYHLIVSDIVEGGMSQFLRKLNIGYAKYYNERHGRSGFLFQGRTKKVRIARDAHFLHMLHYVHLNPLDALRSCRDWRGGRIGSAKKALDFLDRYRWSSFLDYVEQNNFPSILTKDLFRGALGDYRQSLGSFLREIDLSAQEKLLLE